ncbi:hypothetical protein BDQ17DRAFT_1341560 [Cyathus striatus]|nr:hypothetical protein BDQ17DRAFT_1341560 [Cyathus striatus]
MHVIDNEETTHCSHDLFSIITANAQNEITNESVPSEKGKAAAIPMPIPSSAIAHDDFDRLSVEAEGSPCSCETASSSSLGQSPCQIDSPISSSLLTPTPSSYSRSTEESFSFTLAEAASSLDKGKSKEAAPILPPLLFSSSELAYDTMIWSPGSDTPPTPGPSSYGSIHMPTAGVTREPRAESQLSDSPSGISVDSTPAERRFLSRHRSLSSLSTRSNGSFVAFAKEKLKLRKIGSSSQLTRKLFRKRADDRFSGVEIQTTAEQGVKTSFITDTCTLTTLPLPCITTGNGQPVPTSTKGILKRNGRSISSPIPFSAFDYVPVHSADIFQPLPTVIVKSYFDEMLPKELQIYVIRGLVDLYGAEFDNSLQEGRWSALRASSGRNQWTGRNKGIRELFKLSRVSKSWHALVFDGQLWSDLELHSFPGIPSTILSKLAKSAGAFIRTLNLSGHTSVLPESLIELADNLILTLPDDTLTFTQLTNINLHGCSSISTRSLHHLLVRSRFVRTVNLKGLAAVNNTTCDILSNYCPLLTSLNVSRCLNMDAEGIRGLALSALHRGECLLLKELRISGLKHIDDSMMRTLGRAAPYLEILDLSYTRQLHNSALEAFVACDEDTLYHESATVLVSARDIGRNSDDVTKHRRRVTRLHHLSLSHCILLTDMACANISHSVPRLQFLELAGIGADIRSPGLIRLLQMTSMIKRIDLEDASNITDAVIQALTPTPGSEENPTLAGQRQPGHTLEQLIISYAHNITDDALMALVQNCPRLTVLEVDNTRIGSAFFKEFIRLARQRKAANTKLVAVDCRGIGEGLVKDMSSSIRPRLGWRAFSARKLAYLDARDGNEDELKVGQDECDEHRVVVKTFYTWQTVDAVKAVREKRRKSTRRSATGSLDAGLDELSVRATRWWSPGGRRSGGSSPPLISDLNNDGCRIM